MAEILSDTEPKIIAFYLPQFHTIPENDKWWGEGFTEWTNVKKAIPLFQGHHQPRVPLNSNYYNLLDDSTKLWQAQIAKEYGIYGFCYYHYWFWGGKKLLEKPAEQMLENKKIDQPFCFCWANENWSRNWDGGNREVIVRQDYGGESDWEKHFQYLLPFFKDPRYITYDDKPLFIIYKPDLMIDVYQMMGYFRKRAKEEGFRDLCLAFQFPTYFGDMFYRNDVFDFMIEFEPVYSRYMNKPICDKPEGNSKMVQTVRKLFGEEIISRYRKKHRNTDPGSVSKSKYLSMFFYDEAWKLILKQPWTDKLLPGAFVDWDNTPRNKHGALYSGFTVKSFEKNMTELLRRVRQEKKKMIFLNAWNEWGEGAYLEPDERDGFGKLEAVSNALRNSR